MSNRSGTGDLSVPVQRYLGVLGAVVLKNGGEIRVSVEELTDNANWDLELIFDPEDPPFREVVVRAVRRRTD